MDLKKIFFLILGGLTLLSYSALAQRTGTIVGQDEERNVITTAVPFLMIAPDARAGAMGDVGVATSADANSVHWNAAKLAFVENDFGFSLSYTPWLGKIVNDMSISYLSGYYKITREQTVSTSLRYFDLGNINFTGEFGAPLGDYNPRELAWDATYARMLSENLSLGITGRFIYSNLTGNIATTTQDARAGVSVGADLGVYYEKDLAGSNRNNSYSLGATITNIGSKMTYTDESQREFIPTNLRLGAAYHYNLDIANKLTIAMDFNKLMVPTPPVYEVDEFGRSTGVIARGLDPNRTVLSGMFTSFYDAPGGFREEMNEIMIGTGIEYWYNQIFALRTGYFYEHANKGNRKFFTFGLGLRLNVFGIDFAYLVPQQQEHPLAETLRFTLVFNFENQKNRETITE